MNDTSEAEKILIELKALARTERKKIRARNKSNPPYPYVKLPQPEIVAQQKPCEHHWNARKRADGKGTDLYCTKCGKVF